MVMSINGKAAVVFGPEDFAQLVGQYMGREAEEYYRVYAEQAAEEVRKAKAGEESDLASYEASLESATMALQDIQDEVDYIDGLLAAKRIDRAKIGRATHNINTIINNQI